MVNNSENYVVSRRQSTQGKRGFFCRYNAGLLAGLAALGFFTSLWVYFHYGLEFDLFRSDVVWYWRDSLDWQRPFNPNHLPGYPLLIALLRFLTLDQLPPLIIMWSISMISYLVGVWAVFACLASHSGESKALLGAFLFALWPFVGTTYAVYPVADSLALCLFTLGLYFLLGRSFHWASLFLGLALVTHKATWPFVGLLVYAVFVLNRRAWRWKALAIMFLPLFSLWMAGTYYHSSPIWMLSRSLIVEARSRSMLPLLDGLVGTVVFGGTKGLLKGLAIWLIVLLVLILLAVGLQMRTKPEKWYGLAIVGGVLLLCMILNQNTIWAVVRFSKLVALPFIWFLGDRLRLTSARRKVVLIALPTIGLFSSQLAYAWYIARIFFQ